MLLYGTIVENIDRDLNHWGGRLLVPGSFVRFRVFQSELGHEGVTSLNFTSQDPCSSTCLYMYGNKLLMD